MRLIDADKLKNTLKQLDVESNDVKWKGVVEESIHKILPQIIDDELTIEAEPVKWGKWIDVDYKTLEHGFIETYPNEGICCSECRTGFKKSRQLIRNFCPNCGARMDGV